MPMLAGNLVSLLSSAPITVIISLIAPQNFDFAATKAIDLVTDEKAETQVEYNVEEEEDPKALDDALTFAYGWAWALTGVLIFIFPLPLLGQHYIFNKQFFTFWVTIGFIWALMSAFTTILFPVWESREGNENLIF